MKRFVCLRVHMSTVFQWHVFGAHLIEARPFSCLMQEIQKREGLFELWRFKNCSHHSKHSGVCETDAIEDVSDFCNTYGVIKRRFKTLLNENACLLAYYSSSIYRHSAMSLQEQNLSKYTRK